jgi:hypothetical protein
MTLWRKDAIMLKNTVPHLESRIFGLRDYPTLALDAADVDQDLEQLFVNSGDDERIGEDDVDEVLRDFEIRLPDQDD